MRELLEFPPAYVVPHIGHTWFVRISMFDVGLLIAFAAIAMS